MNSNCEISDLIKFLIAFEKKNAFESFKTEKIAITISRASINTNPDPKANLNPVLNSSSNLVKYECSSIDNYAFDPNRLAKFISNSLTN